LEVTYRGAQHNVERLVKAGILSQLGEAAYGRVFVADEILRIIGESGL
jgi:hypothetical protein